MLLASIVLSNYLHDFYESLCDSNDDHKDKLHYSTSSCYAVNLLQSCATMGKLCEVYQMSSLLGANLQLA